MVSARASRSWTIVLAVFALLLKAAVPMLASAAAHLHGVPVAQICDVYGVQTVVDAAADPHAGHEGHAGHADAPGRRKDAERDQRAAAVGIAGAV